MSFLRDYFTYCEIMETPEIYDKWAALSALSALVSRRVWLPFGHFNIIPNLYVILVGGPGQRKDTAMDVAFELVQEAGIATSGTCETKEAICRHMAKECVQTFTYRGEIVEYTHYSLFLTEFSHFIAIAPEHMIDFLTAIWSKKGNYETKTKNAGTDVIIRPCLTMLACTTPSHIGAFLKNDILSGGFNRRCIFVFSDEPRDPIPRPHVTEAAAAAMRRLKARAVELKSLVGEFTVDPEVNAFYDQWYIDTTNSIPRAHPAIQDFLSSKHIQMFKLAMLIALSESNELRITLAHVQLAISFLDEVEQRLHRVFEGVGRNVLNRVSADILRYLKGKNHPLPKRYLIKVFYSAANRAELEEIIKKLEETGQVQRMIQRARNSDGSVGAAIDEWLVHSETLAERQKAGLGTDWPLDEIRQRIASER